MVATVCLFGDSFVKWPGLSPCVWWHRGILDQPPALGAWQAQLLRTCSVVCRQPQGCAGHWRNLGPLLALPCIPGRKYEKNEAFRILSLSDPQHKQQMILVQRLLSPSQFPRPNSEHFNEQKAKTFMASWDNAGNVLFFCQGLLKVCVHTTSENVPVTVRKMVSGECSYQHRKRAKSRMHWPACTVTTNKLPP